MLLSDGKKKTFKVYRDDPLYRIFKKHLYDYQYESRAYFLEAVIEEYMRKMNVGGRIVTTAQEMDRLKLTIEREVMEMLIRKLYGCLELEPPLGETEKSNRSEEVLEANEARSFQKHLQRLLTAG